jgi:hypothetical protein
MITGGSVMSKMAKMAAVAAAVAKAISGIDEKVNIFYHGNVIIRVAEADFVYDGKGEFQYCETQYERWAKVAEHMDSYFAPGSGWYSGETEASEDGGAVWNHWTGAKDILLSKTGWDWLPDEWCTLLSLSLGYGSCPAWDEQTGASIMGQIWPNGNPTGGAIAPSGIVEKLRELKILDFAD